MAKITISYRRDDSMDITGRIFDRLTSRYGRSAVFRDIDSIPPGLDFREHIQASLADSDVLIVVVGPRWTGGGRRGQARIHSETDYVRIEVETALGRGIPVVPLLVGGAEMPEPAELPECLKDFAFRNAVKVDSGRDFDHHMSGLIRATDKFLVVPPEPSPPPQGAVPANRPAEEPASVPTAQDGASSPGVLSGNVVLQMVGGVLVAQGVIHIVWLATYVIVAANYGQLGQLFNSVWTFADIIFGFGGVIVGVGTILGRAWARSAGASFCLLGILAGVLWFVEYFGTDAPKTAITLNGLLTVLSAVGVYLYLFRWPEARQR